MLRFFKIMEVNFKFLMKKAFKMIGISNIISKKLKKP